MPVVVGIPAELRVYSAGATEVVAEGAALGEILLSLGNAHPALGRRLAGPDGSPLPDIDVLEQGHDLRRRGGRRAVVRDGTRLEIRVRRPAPVSLETAERYSRQTLLSEIGLEGQDRLREARVAVIGAGGLGSSAAIYLAGAGVGHLVIIDGDRVERSNLHRQPMHRDADVGRPKVESARRFLTELNPEIEVLPVDVFLTEENAMELLRGMDLVVSGVDSLFARYFVSDACVLLGIPLIDASILRFEGRLSLFLPGQGCYRCLYPVPPPPESVPTCAEAGVVGALAGQIGSLQALEAVKLLTGAGESPVGKLLIFDALSLEMRTFRVQRDPGCAACGDGATRVDLRAHGLGAPREGQELAPEISPQDAALLLGQEGILFLDVRPQGMGDEGTIPGALRLPIESLRAGQRPPLEAKRVIVVCAIGRMSKEAAALLHSEGMAALSLQGGLLAWRALGLSELR